MFVLLLASRVCVFTLWLQFEWPPEATGVERIMLSAQGDLQRLLRFKFWSRSFSYVFTYKNIDLSAFFAQPITVALLHSQTFSQALPDGLPTPLADPNTSIIDSVSPQNPVLQTRQVNILCSGRLVCKATSTVRITCPTSARLFIGEKYAIGQVFRELGKIPRFELIAVGVGESTSGEVGKLPSLESLKRHELWRQYKVDCEGFECEILEIFPTREMFRRGINWLNIQPPADAKSGDVPLTRDFIVVPRLGRSALLLSGLALGFVVNHILHKVSPNC
jgi:hypothetical protein